MPFYDDDAVTIHHGNALDLPVADETIDLVVTSPPYFGLRSYQDDGEHYQGQIGSEATPAGFVDALVAATAEMARVLKPSGSIWVNLGDKYSGAGRGNNDSARLNNTAEMRASRLAGSNRRQHLGLDMAPAKSLMGMPWRYALRCIDDLGLILRAEVIWSKPNGLPESVTDRVRRSHETWFHLTKEQRYFSAVDEIREERAWSPSPGYKGHAAKRSTGDQPDHNFAGAAGAPGTANPLGKLPGSVWEVPTQPLKVPAHLGIDHFAAFPMEWPRRIIRGWSPTGICAACDEGRRPVTAATPEWTEFRERHGLGSWADHSKDATHGSRDTYKHGLSGAEIAAFGPKRAITGYACACPEPTALTRPSVVLDPFGGTGTTALVAKALGRQAVHVDLSQDYCRLAQWRVNDPGELARAMQVQKPPVPPADTDSLLDMLDGTSA